MRKCGDCSACCFIGAVPELNKGPHQKCKFECNGCSIFSSESRPQVCKSYRCCWLQGYGAEADRPDKSGIMTSFGSFNGGTWIFAIEIQKDSLMNSAKSMISALANFFEVPIIVVKYSSKPPNDTGDLAIVKDSLKKRARKMIGKEIGRLADNIGVYELIK